MLAIALRWLLELWRAAQRKGLTQMAWQRCWVSGVRPFQALVCPYRSDSPVTHPDKSPFCSYRQRGAGQGAAGLGMLGAGH